jgi:RNA polymerase sigma factor (TIGR02999 family)
LQGQILCIKLDAMSDVTHILHAIGRGEARATEELLPLVYEELRKLAARKMTQEAPGQTLDATALVHEAYLRLVDQEQRTAGSPWANRGHFFAAAAEAMRRILINRALEKQCLKRGGDRKRIHFDDLVAVDDASNDDLIAIDEALSKLGQENAACADLVKLRFFGGLTQEEAASSLGLARRTADRYWALGPMPEPGCARY